MARKQLLFAALAAGVIQLIGFITNYLVTIATGEKGSTTLLVVAGVVSVIGGTLTLLLQQAMTPKQAAAGGAPTPVPHQGATHQQPQPGGHYGPYGTPPAQQRQAGGGKGRLSLIVALILMIVLCGVGGTAVTSFFTAVIGKLNETSTLPTHFPDPFNSSSASSQDPFKPILAKEASTRSGSLTLKVTAVEANSNEIRVSVTATNTSSKSMTLPLFKNCLLAITGSSTMEADPQSPFTTEVAAKGESTGVIVFHGSTGHAAKARLSFSRIYSFDFDAPENIAVEITFTTGS